MTGRGVARTTFYVGTARIDRVHEPSAVRRGRLAVDPTWVVTFADGRVQRCQTKRAAFEIARASSPGVA